MYQRNIRRLDCGRRESCSTAGRSIMGVPTSEHNPLQNSAARSAHIVQLFDTPESLGDTVARFFIDGLSSGDNLLFIAKTAHVLAVADTMARRGETVSRLVDAGRLVIVDAAITLRRVMRLGVPDLTALRTIVEDAVRQLAPGGRRVSVYGELVELLAEEGNFKGAEQVEAFWNEFGQEYPITLLCGYSSAHFVMPGSLASLENICRAHTRVQKNGHDLLANWLLSRCATSQASGLRGGSRRA